MAAQADKSDEELIGDKLLEFGVVSELTKQADCQFGHKYTYTISRGVPVSKLKKLKEDIEFALNAKTELNLTGKQELTIIVLSDAREAITQPTGEPSKLFIGKSVDGGNVVINLQKDPHVLIAGTTGSGKSYLLTNLIKQARRWSKVKVVDIKGEIGTNAIRSDISAVKMLRSILDSVRAKTADPLIVFIDELGDLILSTEPILTGYKGKDDKPIYEPAGKVIENLLVRICQLGRSQGVHVVAATQRPSIKICTGILKANMPARVGLRTATSIDSKVVINDLGCETLIGNGDAYVVSGGQKIRTQCFS
jgi:S-DNA-T family DNA segregation ATPase FtsK/SpoIIIE